MLTSPRRYRASLAVLIFASLLAALPAVASALEGPTVTVRVEGLTETKLPATQAVTSAAPVVKDGVAQHACSGTSAVGALQIATAGNWSGPWNSEFEQYEIYSIEGETHLFEPEAKANYYWSFWLDEKESSAGACVTELHPGDRVLFFPACFGSACPPEQTPLGIEAPGTAAVGDAVTVTVRRYSSTGASVLLEGATVSVGGASAITGANGQATIPMSQAGQLTIRASAPASVRTEAAICVHAGNDGTCGTTSAPGSNGSTTAGTSTVVVTTAPYKGPFALVAAVKGLSEGHVYGRKTAPRVLAGTIAAHAAVTAVSLELRREFRGHCYAYDGTLERFLSARCGTGSYFPASTGGVFSYLLPSALGPGRYVLDIRATDAFGNHTTLARGSTRLVFYVR